LRIGTPLGEEKTTLLLQMLNSWLPNHNIPGSIKSLKNIYARLPQTPITRHEIDLKPSKKTARAGKITATFQSVAPRIQRIFANPGLLKYIDAVPLRRNPHDEKKYVIDTNWIPSSYPSLPRRYNELLSNGNGNGNGNQLSSRRFSTTPFARAPLRYTHNHMIKINNRTYYVGDAVHFRDENEDQQIGVITALRFKAMTITTLTAMNDIKVEDFCPPRVEV
jgi:hypothetical protein